MFFFLISLIISLTLAIFLFVILTRCLVVNWERKNKHALSYLRPVLLTLVFLYVCLTVTLPCLLDSVAVLSKNLQTEEITLHSDQMAVMGLKVGGQVYHYQPLQFKLEENHTYRLSFTPRSRFIVEVIEISNEER